MRWGTYSDKTGGRNLHESLQVSIAHALGNLFRLYDRRLQLTDCCWFQSLMRWGTYSDRLIVSALVNKALVSIAHALGNLFRPLGFQT